MKRQARIALAVLLMTFVVFVGQSSAQEMGRYIVHTTGDSAVNEAARQSVEDRAGLTLKELPTRTGLVVLIPEVALEHMIKIPGVIAVEPDLVLTAVQAEELPWGVDRIDADLAWGTATGAGVNIAIIDTGIDKDHPDLTVAGGRNFVHKGRRVDPKAWDDDNGHGTHCAGIAAALDNEIGVIGVAPGASLIAVKVLDRSGSGYLSDIMDGIYWAANNANVINLSLGIDKETLDQYPVDKAAFEQAVKDASDAGVVVVAAAGNEGNGGDTVIYPARFPSAIAVSATDSGDNLASFSSTGPSVELAAPGVSIYSTYKDGGYATGDGTSMAAPHVAGTAALVISAGIGDVRTRLQNTADDLGVVGLDPYYGYGLVDADEAAGATIGPQSPVANAGPDQTVSDVDESGFETVTLDGSASYDPDGTIMAYEWNEGTTSLGTAASITFNFAVGVHIVTLTVTDDDGLTDTDDIIITVTEPASIETMHVSSIDMDLSTRKAGKNTFTKALATVTIVDDEGSPVGGATVSGFWIDATSDIDSGVTDSSGKVTLQSDAVKNAPSGTTFTFIVDDVVKSGWYWIYDDKTGSITVP